MAGSFATVTEYTSRWGSPSNITDAQLTIFLADASADLRVLAPTIDARIAAGKLDPVIPERVVCEMVHRSVGIDAPAGVSSAQETTGPFSQSLTFSNPTGELYLTKYAKRLLGIAQQKAFSFDLSGWE